MKVEASGLVVLHWGCVESNKFDVEDKTQWCMDYPGAGKFYVSPIFKIFFFECDEDRLMFLLRWSGK